MFQHNNILCIQQTLKYLNYSTQDVNNSHWSMLQQVIFLFTKKKDVGELNGLSKKAAVKHFDIKTHTLLVN